MVSLVVRNSAFCTYGGQNPPVLWHEVAEFFSIELHDGLRSAVDGRRKGFVKCRDSMRSKCGPSAPRPKLGRAFVEVYGEVLLVNASFINHIRASTHWKIDIT